MAAGNIVTGLALRIAVFSFGPMADLDRALLPDSPRYIALADNIVDHATFGLPGHEPQTISHITHHQDLLPTLYDYLGISGLTPQMMRGHSDLHTEQDENAALTVAGNTRQADLTLKDYVIRYRIKTAWHQITFLPYSMTDRAGHTLDVTPEFFARAVAASHPILRRLVNGDRIQDHTDQEKPLFARGRSGASQP